LPGPLCPRHPSGVDCIEIAEGFGFNLGNVIKYVWRADLKSNDLEDLEKAAWYLSREISRRKEKAETVSEQMKNPFDLLIDEIRAVVREEIRAQFAAMNKVENLSQKDWLKPNEAARLYGLPKTWFEERGRAGDIERTKPGRYVLFARRDIERYLEEHKHKNNLTSGGGAAT
jgi:Protein of unknwon function (DUF3310)/Helix-turn-helix domain